ncbi:MAG: TrkH family potassium uptake protein [Thermodesulfobacteriota bacterium]|nr:TrkH family potassium uptake protein [Thermodesulfobacteriota bacterium]
MKVKNIFHILGAFLFYFGLAMLLPIGWSVYFGEGDLNALLLSLLMTSATGAFFYFLFRPREEKISLTHREGFIIVTAGWILAAAFGSLPYLIYGVFPTFTDAFFESMSGFTTTGATVIANIADIPHGILLWRSLTQWLGGMGIIILSIAILPLLGVGGMQLYKAELPSPVKDKLKPRIAETARILWIVYAIISTVEFILLLFGGMSVFDSMCHTFTTMATGGFSTSDSSIASFHSAYIDAVITVFMLIAGINFSLHYSLLTGNFKTFFKNSELRFFLAVALIATIVVTLNLRLNLFDEMAKSFRYASFQVVSIFTTTGYTTDNFASWPALSKIILLLLMFVGGSAGSTGGSIKCLRVLLIIKHAYKELYRLIHPHAVATVKLGKNKVSAEVMGSIWGFFILYLSLTVVATLIMSFLGLDMMTAFSSVAATIGNVGPGFGMVGPSSTYSEIPYLGKWVLSFCMLVGRLEIYTVIVLLIPEFWRK